MKILLILIMVNAAIMLITYFTALFKNSTKLLLLFRYTMLTLILLLCGTWVTSLVLGQPFHMLLGLIVIFIILYAFS